MLNSKEKKLTEMMYNTGNYLVAGTGAFFWANTNHKGCLIEAANNEDIYIIQKLAREHRGGVILETKTFYIK